MTEARGRIACAASTPGIERENCTKPLHARGLG
jgi:hypothetical protein